jgi:acyl transferase domain-containing protein
MVFFEADIGTEQMPVMTDHGVDGSAVLPSATLLKLVFTTATEAFGAGRRLVRDVVFHRSLILADGQSRTLQLVLQGNPPGAVSFECYYAEPARSGLPEWSLLASGTVETAEADTADEERHLPEVTRTHCPEAIPGPSFYHRLAKHGLQYEPGVQTVQEVWRRDGEATARLTPPAAGSSTVDAGDLDAALLDACFQILTAALPARNGYSHDTYLPVGLSEMRVYRRPVGGGAWCHAVLRTGDGPKNS